MVCEIVCGQFNFPLLGLNFVNFTHSISFLAFRSGSFSFFLYSTVLIATLCLFPIALCLLVVLRRIFSNWLYFARACRLLVRVRKSDMRTQFADEHGLYVFRRWIAFIQTYKRRRFCGGNIISVLFSLFPMIELSMVTVMVLFYVYLTSLRLNCQTDLILTFWRFGCLFDLFLRNTTTAQSTFSTLCLDFLCFGSLVLFLYRLIYYHIRLSSSLCLSHFCKDYYSFPFFLRLIACLPLVYAARFVLRLTMILAGYLRFSLLVANLHFLLFYGFDHVVH